MRLKVCSRRSIHAYPRLLDYARPHFCMSSLINAANASGVLPTVSTPMLKWRSFALHPYYTVKSIESSPLIFLTLERCNQENENG